ncbi:uncharacterized protein LOC143876878 [Tasmannia lanceolata]|uniref:uncharacterized protein LOC143876878 n=1 Tax=Tasmannia lanceolata TaxID=3420 RepID=UPI0040644985
MAVWQADNIKIQGLLVRFLRWTPDFSPGEEPPLAPVWITLPGLPLFCYNEDFLVSVGGLVGRVLKIHGPTSIGTRTEAARLCIGLRINAPHPEWIWLGFPGQKGRWQKVVYERIPFYCNYCHKFGHNHSIYKFSPLIQVTQAATENEKELGDRKDANAQRSTIEGTTKA